MAATKWTARLIRELASSAPLRAGPVAAPNPALFWAVPLCNGKRHREKPTVDRFALLSVVGKRGIHQQPAGTPHQQPSHRRQHDQMSLDELQATALKGFQDPALARRAIIETLNHKRHAQALQIFEENPAVRQLLNNKDYTRLLRAGNAVGNGERTKRVFEAMTTAARIPPDHQALSALLKAYHDSRQPAEAVALLERMRAEGCALASRDYALCIGALSEGGEEEGVRAAEALLERMESEGVSVASPYLRTTLQSAF